MFKNCGILFKRAKPIHTPRLIVLAGILLLAGPWVDGRKAQASDQRLWLAQQYNWEGKTGFYLDFENHSPKGQPCTLNHLKLVMGVADGSRWRFIRSQHHWQLDRTYHAIARWNDGKLNLRIEGQSATGIEAAFKPNESDEVRFSYAPGWANHGTTTYLIQPMRVAISVGQLPPVVADFTELAKRPMRLALFQPLAERHDMLTIAPGQSLTVDATFRIVKRPDIKPLAPFVDRYGQAIASEDVHKIRQDEELQQRDRQEQQWLKAHPWPLKTDPYGGRMDLGWSSKATGFFRVEKYKGMWWLISPQGHPLFYRGVGVLPSWNRPGSSTPVTGREFLFDWLPSRDGALAGAWRNASWNDHSIQSVSFLTANLIRKYGRQWKPRIMRRMRHRLTSWGFNGLGKWSSEKEIGRYATDIQMLPLVGHLDLSGVPGVDRLPDVFDARVRQAIHDVLAAQVADRRDSPWILGWSIGNEKSAIPSPDDIDRMLKQSADTPVKQKLIDYGVKTLYAGNVPAAARAWDVEEAGSIEDIYQDHPRLDPHDMEMLRRFYANHYYQCLYETVKTVDPNHLYLGNWPTPRWWYNDADWGMIARHCDLVGMDIYGIRFMPEWFRRMVHQTNKPTLVGEFGFPIFDHGQRGYGQYRVSAANQDDAGRMYHDYVHEAATDPYCVGVMWFTAQDQPITGRGSHGMKVERKLVIGEHYAFGLVDITDTPKWKLIRAIRQTNLRVEQWRSGRQ